MKTRDYGVPVHVFIDQCDDINCNLCPSTYFGGVVVMSNRPAEPVNPSTNQKKAGKRNRTTTEHSQIIFAVITRNLEISFIWNPLSSSRGVADD
jgi:hypothetical protein